MSLNTVLNQDGQIVVSNGTATKVLSASMRDITLTEPMGSEGFKLTPVQTFQTVMMDKRAPGLFTASFAGPNAKMEWLAEQMVKADVVARTARLMVQPDLIEQINSRLLKNNSRFRRDVVALSYPALYRAVREIAGAGSDLKDPNRVVARILTELLARSYAALGVMMPTKPFFAQTYYENAVAGTRDLIEAAHVATVTDVLETIKLGEALKVKEVAPGVVENIMGPMMVQAAHKLLSAEKYNRWMRDAACIVGKYLRNADDPVLDSMRDNGDLMALALNASFGYEAAALFSSKAVLSPAHEHSELLGYAALRLRELKRYETVSVEKFRSMYHVEFSKTAKGYIAGVFVSPNMVPKSAVKGIVFADAGDMKVPLHSHILDPYVAGLNDMANSAFSGESIRSSAAFITSHVMARAAEERGEEFGKVALFMMSEKDLAMLGLVSSDTLIFASNELDTRVYYGVRDAKLYYKGDAYYTGDLVYTMDPGEALIVSGSARFATQVMPTRPQTYPEELLGGLIDGIDPELYVLSTKRTALKFPYGSEFIDLDISLHSLLTDSDKEEIAPDYIARDTLMSDWISAYFGLALVCYNELINSENAVDRVIAEQIATNMHDSVARFAKSASFGLFKRTIMQRLAAARVGDRDVRRTLSMPAVQHEIAIRLAVTLLLRMGMQPYGMQDDVISVLQDSNALERAITSDAFGRAMNQQG